MSRNDIWIVGAGGKTANPVRKFALRQGEAAILAGEPTKVHVTVAANGAIGFYPILLSDANTLAAGFYFLGIAAADSTQTGTADGEVEVFLDLPGTIYSIAPKTAAAADSNADVNGKQFYRLNIDLTSSKFTIDDTTADNVNGPFIVVGGDPLNDRFHVVANNRATWRIWGANP